MIERKHLSACEKSMFAVICLNRRRAIVEYPPEQGHWSIPREGSAVVPREVNTCFLGHFTAWVESDIRDVFAQLTEELINSRARRFCARQSQISVSSVVLGTSSAGQFQPDSVCRALG